MEEAIATRSLQNEIVRCVWILPNLVDAGLDSCRRNGGCRRELGRNGNYKSFQLQNRRQKKTKGVLHVAKHTCHQMLRTSGLLGNRFLLDDDFQMRGHVFVQLYRDGKFTDRLQRFMELNLTAIHIKSFLDERIRNIAGCD